MLLQDSRISYYAGLERLGITDELIKDAVLGISSELSCALRWWRERSATSTDGRSISGNAT